MPDLDMINRDPNNINDHIMVSFEDVLAEPDGAHSCDCVWRCSSCCFNFGKNCCYRLMTTLCGMFIALYWGCEFAFLAFEHVWFTTPSMRIFIVNMGYYQKLFGTCVACCLAPICESSGLIFSKITITRN